MAGWGFLFLSANSDVEIHGQPPLLILPVSRVGVLCRACPADHTTGKRTCVRNSRPWCRTLHSLITPQGRRPSQRLQSGITRPRCAARVWPPRPQGRTMVGPVVPVVPGVSPVALLPSRRPPHHHCCTKPRLSNHLHVRPKPCCSASACRVSAGGLWVLRPAGALRNSRV